MQRVKASGIDPLCCEGQGPTGYRSHRMLDLSLNAMKLVYCMQHRVNIPNCGLLYYHITKSRMLCRCYLSQHKEVYQLWTFFEVIEGVWLKLKNWVSSCSSSVLPKPALTDLIFGHLGAAKQDVSSTLTYYDLVKLTWLRCLQKKKKKILFTTPADPEQC